LIALILMTKNTDIPKPLTVKQLKDYVKHGGSYCPVCRSDSLEGESYDYGVGVVYQSVLCLSCGARWTDGYTLTSVWLDEE